jgi:hypothetical protein
MPLTQSALTIAYHDRDPRIAVTGALKIIACAPSVVRWRKAPRDTAAMCAVIERLLARLLRA